MVKQISRPAAESGGGISLQTQSSVVRQRSFKPPAEGGEFSRQSSMARQISEQAAENGGATDSSPQKQRAMVKQMSRLTAENGGTSDSSLQKQVRQISWPAAEIGSLQKQHGTFKQSKSMPAAENGGGKSEPRPWKKPAMVRQRSRLATENCKT